MDRYGRQKPMDGRGNQVTRRQRQVGRKSSLNNRTECPAGQELNSEGLCEERCCIIEGPIQVLSGWGGQVPVLLQPHFEVRLTQAFCSDTEGGHIGTYFWGCWANHYGPSVICGTMQTSLGPGEPNISNTVANTASLNWLNAWGTEKRACHQLDNSHPEVPPKSNFGMRRGGRIRRRRR